MNYNLAKVLLMKILFAALLVLFAISSVWGKSRTTTLESCITAPVDPILLSNYFKDDEIKIDTKFLFCLNQTEGVFYHSLFDVPDNILQKRYDFIMSERASK